MSKGQNKTKQRWQLALLLQERLADFGGRHNKTAGVPAFRLESVHSRAKF
jgi:hypothetical protein